MNFGKNLIKEPLAEIAAAIWYASDTPCVVCHEGKGDICPECISKYFKSEFGRCRTCGKIISSSKELCQDCLAQKGPKNLSKVESLGWYQGDWKEFIWTVKFKAQPHKLKKLAKQLSDKALETLPVPDGIIPVPMHPERLAERGFNQAEVIASLLHWQLGLPVHTALERIIHTPSQVNLNRRERLQNLQGAIKLKDEYHFKPLERVWLVDDVSTTGATLEACAIVLKTAGIKEVYALCLAAGMEKDLVSSGE